MESDEIVRTESLFTQVIRQHIVKFLGSEAARVRTEIDFRDQVSLKPSIFATVNTSQGLNGWRVD
jgi:hypothetical protein